MRFVCLPFWKANLLPHGGRTGVFGGKGRVGSRSQCATKHRGLLPVLPIHWYILWCTRRAPLQPTALEMFSNTSPSSCASLGDFRSARDQDSYIKLILKVTKVHLHRGAFRILQQQPDLQKGGRASRTFLPFSFPCLPSFIWLWPQCTQRNHSVINTFCSQLKRWWLDCDKIWISSFMPWCVSCGRDTKRLHCRVL